MTINVGMAPLHNGRPAPHVCADLGDGSWLESFVVNVRLDQLDDLVWNVVLVELEQTVEELLWIGQKQLPRLPVVVFLLSRLLRQSEM